MLKKSFYYDVFVYSLSKHFLCTKCEPGTCARHLTLKTYICALLDLSGGDFIIILVFFTDKESESQKVSSGMGAQTFTLHQAALSFMHGHPKTLLFFFFWSKCFYLKQIVALSKSLHSKLTEHNRGKHDLAGQCQYVNILSICYDWGHLIHKQSFLDKILTPKY